ncbi:hypothetical protein IG631_03053 [Alternaria alternata]|nr:hypothetical protein IG631_03053 [Alternaria alternata]
MRRLKKSGVPMPAQQVPWGTCPCSGPTYYHTFARFPLLSDQNKVPGCDWRPQPVLQCVR